MLIDTFLRMIVMTFEITKSYQVLEPGHGSDT